MRKIKPVWLEMPKQNWIELTKIKRFKNYIWHCEGKFEQTNENCLFFCPYTNRYFKVLYVGNRLGKWDIASLKLICRKYKRIPRRFWPKVGDKLLECGKAIKEPE